MVSRRPSPSASVVKQVAEKRKIVDFESASNALHSGLHHGVDQQTGYPNLTAVYPLPGQDFQRLSLTFFLEFPNLAHLLSAGFDRWARAGKSPVSRSSLISTLKSGFLAYLIASDATEIDPGQLTLTFFHGFKNWLDRPDVSGDTAALHPTSRANYFSAISIISTALVTLPEWERVGKQILANLPVNPWSGRHLKANPTVRLHRDHLISIIAAASRELQSISDCWEQNKKRLALANDGYRDESPRDDLISVLRTISERYPEVIPRAKAIASDDAALGRAVARYDYKYITKHFYPGPRDLICMVVLLAVATAFNSSTLLRLDWSGIEFSQRLGAPTVRIGGPKLRSSVDQSILFDASVSDDMSITKLLSLVKEMTARIRPAVREARRKDRVFLYVPLTSPNGIRKISSFDLGANDAQAIAFTHNLKLFAKENGLGPFNLSQVRVTMIDEVHLITGDLIATKHFAKHKSAKTTWQHYNSDGTRRRYNERLGEVFLLRERWLTTSGLIDPRNVSLTPSMDRGAATPGFLCLDPMDSPRPGQTKNRLCSAYGECPSCPLCAANVADVGSVALYRALRSAITSAQGRMGTRTWSARWGSVLADLDALLEHVPPEVSAKASAIARKLPMVG